MLAAGACHISALCILTCYFTPIRSFPLIKFSPLQLASRRPFRTSVLFKRHVKALFNLPCLTTGEEYEQMANTVNISTLFSVTSM
jgi:hypothetical protein